MLHFSFRQFSCNFISNKCEWNKFLAKISTTVAKSAYYYFFSTSFWTRTTDTQWRHKSKISEKLGRCGRQNMLWPYLKIWEWEWFFGRAVKAISSLGVRSPCLRICVLDKSVVRRHDRHCPGKWIVGSLSCFKLWLSALAIVSGSIAYSQWTGGGKQGFEEWIVKATTTPLTWVDSTPGSWAG